jgi:hypothetical protein
VNHLYAKAWLEKTDHDWLLILENVDDDSLDIYDLVPVSMTGSVIITTSNPKCGRFATVGTQELGFLGLEDSAKLLLKISRIEQRFWKENFYDACKVIAILRHDTLGIVLAGSLISSRLCTLKQYPKLYQKQKETPLSWSLQFLSQSNGESLIAFRVSKDVMRLSRYPECDDALELLSTLAWLHHENVPDEIFFRKADNSPLAEVVYYQDENSSVLPKWLPSRYASDLQDNDSEPFNDRAFRRATRMLSLMSFITINPENGDISMHPLLHLWARKDIEQDQIWHSWANTISLIVRSTSLTYYENQRHVVIPHGLQSHVKHCAKRRPSLDPVSESSLQICKTILTLGLILHRTECWTEALDTALLALTIANEKDELRTHIIRKSALALLGICEASCGDVESAIQRFKEIIAFCDRSTSNDSGPIFPENAVLDAKYRLAEYYLRSGNSPAALPLLKIVVDAWTRQDPPPQLLLMSQDDLIRTYLKLDQPENALKLLRSVIEQRQRVYEKDHPNLIRAFLLSVEAYMALGQLIVASTSLNVVKTMRSLSLEGNAELEGDIRRLSSKLEALTEALNEQDTDKPNKRQAVKKVAKPKL